ncbi:hypothetical protein FGG08_000591 [Glutinoglossum americanum]|uniref:AMP-dependent synthetase/ligase domain-containing protein n=1 Tax=Glutinoglossum americanum TaxID=1670608 RepID=A0A9P8L6R7_9PEZI|nr:hypothetical protein FGG08_000591 [Glutinoglossum americanum]
MAGDNIVQQIDTYLTELLGGWNIYTTAIVVVILTFLLYSLFTPHDPDTHPVLLARQSSVSPVRLPGESAVYRSPEITYGHSLRAGLGVKEPGAPKWAAGKDGDLRDVWRQTVRGAIGDSGEPTGKTGSILTVLGKERILEHRLDEVSRQINIIGQYIRQHNGQRIAIYLPNSIEFLTTVFGKSTFHSSNDPLANQVGVVSATTFYGITPILIPCNLPVETLIHTLQKTKPDFLIAAAGGLPLTDIVRFYGGLKQVVWVVEEGSRHMDWNEVPEGIGGQAGVGVWHEIVEEKKSTVGTALPDNTENESLKDLVVIWHGDKDDVGEVVEFTQENLVAGIAGIISSLPVNQRYNSSDLLLPVEPLSMVYPLALTFAALYSGASVVLNSAISQKTDLALATRSVSPTIVVASPEIITKSINKTRSEMTMGWHKLVYWFETRALTIGGRMPVASIFSSLFDYARPAIGEQPGKLRLLYVAERANTGCPPLDPVDLSDLRAFTGARVVYALTAARVAGAVCQTSIYDYRKDDARKGKHSHFGIPLSSVEVKVVDTPSHKITDEGDPTGEIVATGPAVAGRQAALGVIGTFRDDGTLAYV